MLIAMTYIKKPTNTSYYRSAGLGEAMGDFDSSDDDNVENLPPLPHDQFRIDWLNLPRLGLHNTLALSALPGCRLLLLVFWFLAAMELG